MVVSAPVVFKEVVVFKNAVSLSSQDPAPLPSFGDFKHFFEDFARLHSLSVWSERALLGKIPLLESVVSLYSHAMKC